VKVKVGQIRKVNGELTASDVESAQALGRYFSEVFIREGEYKPEYSEDVNVEAGFGQINIDRNTVMKKLQKLQMDKAQGPDDIHPAVLRNCAEIISKPLTMIYEKSLQEGKLPDDWKVATVIPIYKKGSKNDAGNYRPVSLTSVPCKVLESVMKDAMVDYLETTGFYNDCQHGFVKGKSTLTNLLETLESWTRILDEGLGIDVIYLDYRKAFDTVPHKRLIDKLRGSGINGSLLRWIDQFLLDRKMRVQVNGSLSDWFKVFSGVPQGSVLGPLLFLVYVQDLPQWVTNSIMMFADDTKLWARISTLEDGQSLQRDLQQLAEWSKKWLLAFNPAKCKVMHIGHEVKTSYTMTDGDSIKTLDTTTEEKDLGILVTRDLKSQEQCIQSAKKAQSVLGMVKRHFKELDKEDFLIIYNTYIRPHLEYCVQAWSPHLVKDKVCLERIQRRATKMVKEVKKLKYEDRLRKLGIYSLERRRLRGDLIEVYKVLSGKEKVNKDKFFTLAQDNHGLRGHNQRLFKPRCRTTVRKQFFTNRIINQWNSLPQEVINATTVNIFKNRLDKTWKDMGINS